MIRQGQHLEGLQKLVLGEGVEEGIVGALEVGQLARLLAGTALAICTAPVPVARQQCMHAAHHLRHHLYRITPL